MAFKGIAQYSTLRNLLYRERGVLKQLESFHSPAPVHEFASVEGVLILKKMKLHEESIYK